MHRLLIVALLLGVGCVTETAPSVVANADATPNASEEWSLLSFESDPSVETTAEPAQMTAALETSQLSGDTSVTVDTDTVGELDATLDEPVETSTSSTSSTSSGTGTTSTSAGEQTQMFDIDVVWEGDVDCLPGVDADQWVLEGKAVVVGVACQTGVTTSTTSFSFEMLPEGASYDDANRELSWTPTLAQAGVYDLKVVESTTGEWGYVRIGVADAYDDPNNEPLTNLEGYTHELGLPVVHLETSPEISDDEYEPAVVTYGGHTYYAEAKLRGASSLSYPQNNYTLKFTKHDKFSDASIIEDFVEKRKLVLTTTFDDNSYIRQRLAFELWNRLDSEHIQVDSYNVVLYLDGKYHGIYLLGDHIDKHLMEAQGLNKEGNLYKARKHEANFRLVDHDSEWKSSPHEGMTKSEGTPDGSEPGAFEDLDEFVWFCATADDSEFEESFDEVARQRDYENWWILVSAIGARDSAGKNSYHYHDPDGGPWRAVPWDFNESFGQDWKTTRVEWEKDPEDLASRNGIFERFLDGWRMGDPIRKRYALVLDDQFQVDVVLGLIDMWTEENKMAAERNEEMWGTEYRTFKRWEDRVDVLSHDDEVDFVREWITSRWEYLRDQY